MAYDEGLAQRIRENLTGQSDLVEKQMFGGIGFMAQGNMVCGFCTILSSFVSDPIATRKHSHNPIPKNSTLRVGPWQAG